VTLRETATTGVEGLDRALGGLFWGDNVVWEGDDEARVRPFFAAVAESAGDYASAAYVTVATPPEEVSARYPGFEILDARPETDLGPPRALFERVRALAGERGPALLLFDPLDACAENWGVELASRFFVRSCPLLLQLGAIAYWSVVSGSRSSRLRDEIEGITQCVFVVGDGRLRIAKAEGRGPGVQGSVFRYALRDGRPSLSEAPAAARLGAALRAVRAQRRLSQSGLAQLAGVSPSAISQAERGVRGLSLDTLLELTAKLNMSLDELLRGEIAAGYRLARRDDPRHRLAGRPVPLLDDPRAGLRVYLVRLGAGESVTSPFVHKGAEVVAIASGLVQVLLATGRPVLRPGETLLADSSGVTGWRNIGDAEALVFWILHDDLARPAGDGGA